MSSSSSPSRTHDHLLPPPHREASSQPPLAAVEAAGFSRCLPWETSRGETRTRRGAIYRNIRTRPADQQVSHIR
jgi:hypothetical protein